MVSGRLRRERSRALAGLQRAFRHVRRPVDDLQVRGAPEAEQLRPRPLAVLAPDAEQGRTMIDLGALEQPRAGLAAAPLLPAPQQTVVVARSGPELPRRNAAGMPGGLAVDVPVTPEVAVPSETENRLAADAAMPGTERK